MRIQAEDFLSALTTSKSVKNYDFLQSWSKI